MKTDVTRNVTFEQGKKH